MSVLLEEDRTKARIEGTNALVPQDFPKTTDQTVGETRCRDKTNTGSLKGAESNRGKELGATSRSGVDSSAVLAGLFKTKNVDSLFLEEFITAKLESSLHEITGKGRTEASRESTNAFAFDNLTEAANHTTVVGCWVQLDPSFHTIGVLVYIVVELELMEMYTSTGVKAP